MFSKTFMDDLPAKPSPYLRWGIIEDVSLVDISYKGYSPFGYRSKDIVFTYARTASIRWLDGPGGRDSVKFIEPIGVTSVPMKGSVVAVLFTGPTGDPVIIGSWTQAYKSRTRSELGNLNPGQEIWRKSGLAFRIIPYYDDLRSYSEQYAASPWSLDLIMGEQHDKACFCPTCQTRYPAHVSYSNGKPVYSCPLYCEVCAAENTHSKLILVHGSVSPGEGDAWAETQADLLVSSILRGLYTLADERILGEYITDKSAQQSIRQYFRTYIYDQLGPTYTPTVRDYYVNYGMQLWRQLLVTYISEGDIHANISSDIPGGIGDLLIVPLSQLLINWIQSDLKYFVVNTLSGAVSEEEANKLITALRDNLETYIKNYIPAVISQSFQRFIYNKSRTYISENIALLRRKASSWVYNLALRDIESSFRRSMRGWLDKNLSGFRKVYFDIQKVTLEAAAEAAQSDFIKQLDKSLEKLQDPEELPIMELRVNQDLASVVDTRLGREEGKGDKAARLRVKIYRDGAIKMQVQESVFIDIDPSGTVDIQCSELNIDTSLLHANLANTSRILPQEKLQIGLPDKEYKPVTLDKDDVMESKDFRGFIEKIAWAHISNQLNDIFSGSSLEGYAPDVVNKIRTEATTSPFSVPVQNQVIGNTKASSEHLDGN